MEVTVHTLSEVSREVEITATAADVLRLIDHVKKTVAKKTGVELELEIKVVGV